MLSKYWKLWQDRLEEAEDKSFQPLAEMAQKNYRCFFFMFSFSVFTFLEIVYLLVYRKLHIQVSQIYL